MSVNTEDWDVDFAFANFWSTAVNLPRKRILAVFESFIADHDWRREWNWQKIREVFPKKINERILRQWKQTYLKKLLCLLQCFFLEGPMEERWKRLRDRHRFPNYSSVTLRSSALSFDRMNFFNVANVFSLSRKPLYLLRAIVFVSQ